MFPYRRLLAFSFGLVGLLLLMLLIKLYQGEKPLPSGDDKGAVRSLISTVTIISSDNYSVAEELSFSLKKPISEITRLFPKEIAHSLGIQAQSVTFNKALEIGSFSDIPIEQIQGGVVMKFPFKTGYRLDYSVVSPPIERDGFKYFYFKQTYKFPLDIPSAKIVIKFKDPPAEVKGFIETNKFNAMKGKTSAGTEVTAYLPETESALVSETEDGFVITNPRPLLPGETLSVLAIL